MTVAFSKRFTNLLRPLTKQMVAGFQLQIKQHSYKYICNLLLHKRQLRKVLFSIFYSACRNKASSFVFAYLSPLTGQNVSCHVFNQSELNRQPQSKRDLKRTGISLLCFHVLHKTSHYEFLGHSRAVDVKEMCQRARCTCKFVVLLIQPFFFLFHHLVAVVVMVISCTT